LTTKTKHLQKRITFVLSFFSVAYLMRYKTPKLAPAAGLLRTIRRKIVDYKRVEAL
jgi:hypothetical protein